VSLISGAIIIAFKVGRHGSRSELLTERAATVESILEIASRIEANQSDRALELADMKVVLFLSVIFQEHDSEEILKSQYLIKVLKRVAAYANATQMFNKSERRQYPMWPKAERQLQELLTHAP